MNDSQYNLFAFVSFILSLFLPADAAAAWGNYVAIALAAFGGSTVWLKKQPKRGLRAACNALAYRMFIVSLITGSVAEILQLLWPEMMPKKTILPITFALAAWFEPIRDTIGSAIKTFVNRKANGS